MSTPECGNPFCVLLQGVFCYLNVFFYSCGGLRLVEHRLGKQKTKKEKKNRKKNLTLVEAFVSESIVWNKTRLASSKLKLALFPSTPAPTTPSAPPSTTSLPSPLCPAPPTTSTNPAHESTPPSTPLSRCTLPAPAPFPTPPPPPPPPSPSVPSGEVARRGGPRAAKCSEKSVP